MMIVGFTVLLVKCGAKVYERSGAGNRHFCDLLAKIEDHINMILNLFFTGNCGKIVWNGG